MFGHDYAHGTIRRYVTLFGTLFNDIIIHRTDGSNNQVNTIKVPITYGPKEKVLARLNADPDLNRPYSIILPYMTFQMGGIKYNSQNKLNTLGRNCYSSNDKNFSTYVYNPVPYDIAFELTIVVKNIEDGAKIIEQILPFFTPDWTTSIRIIDDPEIIIDVPLILNSVDNQDTWEGNFETRRYIVWTLNFTMKGQLYGPINTSKVIKKVISHISTSANGNIAETIVVTPGLTANGQPTSNSAETVPYSQIDWNDDYGYIITVNEGNNANT